MTRQDAKLKLISSASNTSATDGDNITPSSSEIPIHQPQPQPQPQQHPTTTEEQEVMANGWVLRIHNSSKSLEPPTPKSNGEKGKEAGTTTNTAIVKMTTEETFRYLTDESEESPAQLFCGVGTVGSSGGDCIPNFLKKSPSNNSFDGVALKHLNEPLLSADELDISAHEESQDGECEIELPNVSSPGNSQKEAPVVASPVRLASPRHNKMRKKENVSVPVRNTSVPTWTFSAPEQVVPWSIASSNFLTVTYIPSSEAIPNYTNQNVAMDYTSRFLPSTCSSKCHKQQHVYKEVYTHDHVDHIHILDEGIHIQGIQGTCRAMQIHLRAKQVGRERFPGYANMKTTSVKARTQLEQQLERSQRNQLIPSGGGGGGGDDEHEHEHEHEHDPKDEDNDDFPIPPWCTDENDSKTVYGPILTFAIPDLTQSYQKMQNDSETSALRDAPPLLWKVDFPPDPSIAVEAFTVLDGSLDVVDNWKEPPHLRTYGTCSNSGSSSESSWDDDSTSPSNIYINGYQSWSFAGSVDKGERQPTSAMPDFLSKAFNYGASVAPDAAYEIYNDVEEGPTSNGGTSVDKSAFYKSDFYTCVCSEATSKEKFTLVLGFLSQTEQYGLVTFDSSLSNVAMTASFQGMIASRSEGISTDWAYCQIMSKHCYDEEPLAHYLNTVSSYNHASPLQNKPPMTGWCSWYHYYENIDFDNLTDNFENLNALRSQIKSDVSIIDDGYITAWGDWDSLKRKGFPPSKGGMKSLGQNIEINDMKPGLWLAPYACDKFSKVAKEHPQWILRNDKGRIANSSNCGKFFYALDATNPEVRQYAYDNIKRAVHEWGYKVLKLDFLYAACLPGNGKYDLTISRAQTMRLALQTLRAAAGPDTFLIGCGCPLGPAIGLMDAMRISADTGPTWYPEFPLPWWDNGTLPSLRAMIRNSLTRTGLGHRWWHNDPDCLLLGETTNLTHSEIVSAATIIGMSGGMLLLSDDLGQLSDTRVSIATKIFPLTGVTAATLDLHDTTESGIPSILRIWCCDTIMPGHGLDSINIAAKNAARAAFSPHRPWDDPSRRTRSCVPVANGLGSWSVVSISNWLDEYFTTSIPMSSLLLPPSQTIGEVDHVDNALEVESNSDLGYHIFAFWSSKYIWVSNENLDSQQSLSKRLGPHESEILHVKPVCGNKPQYIGSNLHFSCGYEVQTFQATQDCVEIQLKTENKRNGFVYLFLPTEPAAPKVRMNGKSVEAEIVAKTPRTDHGKTIYHGTVIKVGVEIKADTSSEDGLLKVWF